MAVYKTLTTYSGTISFDNYIIGSKIVKITDEDKLYPASNLLNPIMSKTFRTNKIFNERNGYFQVGFDVGSAVTPTVLALINTNITKTSGSGCYLIGSTSADFSTSQTIYDAFPLYETKTRVLRWYLDTPTTNNGLSKQYWAIRFYPNDWGNGFVDDSYFEIGNIWLGTYSELKHNYASKISKYDLSSREKSFSNSVFVDQNDSGHKVTSQMPYVTKSTRQTFINNFYTYRSNSHVLLDFEPFIDDVSSSTGGLNCYYGKLDDKIGIDIQFSGLTNMNVGFMESVG
jgi:hypothetical protein